MEARLEELSFTALTNQPVSFRVFTSSTRLGDSLGDVVTLSADEVSELPPIRTVLRFGKGSVQRLPVRLGVHLSAVGTLEIWCYAEESDHRWQLAFDVRQAADGVTTDRGEILDQGLIEAAQAEVVDVYAGKGSPAKLRDRLEEVVGLPKEQWPTTLIRQLADTFIEHMDARSRSADHEARWLNLLGYCLRPGYGDPVDEWRMKQVWRLFLGGIEFLAMGRCATSIGSCGGGWRAAFGRPTEPVVPPAACLHPARQPAQSAQRQPAQTREQRRNRRDLDGAGRLRAYHRQRQGEPGPRTAQPDVGQAHSQVIVGN
ncbi:MAG: hypothetical protein R2856_00825 [Caldilineaceae bacterium]